MFCLTGLNKFLIDFILNFKKYEKANFETYDLWDWVYGTLSQLAQLVSTASLILFPVWHEQAAVVPNFMEVSSCDRWTIIFDNEVGCFFHIQSC